MKVTLSTTAHRRIFSLLPLIFAFVFISFNPLEKPGLIPSTARTTGESSLSPSIAAGPDLLQSEPLLTQVPALIYVPPYSGVAGAQRFAKQLFALYAQQKPIVIGQPEQGNATRPSQDGIIGVYAQDEFALPVIQQPQSKQLYVSNKLGLVTQFKSAADNGVTGLLAHNFLSGKDFYKLQVGQVVWVIYDDQNVRPYRIADIRSYQKLEPANIHSDYLDLGDQTKLSTNELFDRYYLAPHHLVFQTCLEQGGLLSWGLFFVTALPLGW